MLCQSGAGVGLQNLVGLKAADLHDLLGEGLGHDIDFAVGGLHQDKIGGVDGPTQVVGHGLRDQKRLCDPSTTDRCVVGDDAPTTERTVAVVLVEQRRPDVVDLAAAGAALPVDLAVHRVLQDL